MVAKVDDAGSTGAVLGTQESLSDWSVSYDSGISFDVVDYQQFLDITNNSVVTGIGPFGEDVTLGEQNTTVVTTENGALGVVSTFPVGTQPSVDYAVAAFASATSQATTDPGYPGNDAFGGLAQAESDQVDKLLDQLYNQLPGSLTSRDNVLATISVATQAAQTLERYGDRLATAQQQDLQYLVDQGQNVVTRSEGLESFLSSTVDSLSNISRQTDEFTYNEIGRLIADAADGALNTLSAEQFALARALYPDLVDKLFDLRTLNPGGNPFVGSDKFLPVPFNPDVPGPITAAQSAVDSAVANYIAINGSIDEATYNRIENSILTGRTINQQDIASDSLYYGEGGIKEELLRKGIIEDRNFRNVSLEVTDTEGYSQPDTATVSLTSIDRSAGEVSDTAGYDTFVETEGGLFVTQEDLDTQDLAEFVEAEAQSTVLSIDEPPPLTDAELAEYGRFLNTGTDPGEIGATVSDAFVSEEAQALAEQQLQNADPTQVRNIINASAPQSVEVTTVQVSDEDANRALFNEDAADATTAADPNAEFVETEGGLFVTQEDIDSEVPEGFVRTDTGLIVAEEDLIAADEQVNDLQEPDDLNGYVETEGGLFVLDSELNTAPAAVGGNFTSVYNPETGNYDVVDLDNGETVRSGLTEQEASLAAQDLSFGDPTANDEELVLLNPEDVNVDAENVTDDPTATDDQDNDVGATGADTGPNDGETAVVAAAENARQQQAILAQNGQAQQADWRVKLQLAVGADYLYRAGDPGILAPLAVTDGVIFPYTPSIQTTYGANYSPYDLTHSNYRGYFYQNSYVDQISITGTFTAQDTNEANYLLAVIHFLKSVTKMFYGQDWNRGVPPPLVFLSGLGDYQFNEHPCVVRSFNFQLPTDVDYIRARTANIDGSNLLRRRARQTATTNPLSAILDRLRNNGLSPGAVTSVPAPPTLGLDSPTYVPTKMDIVLELLPIQSREQVSQQFSLEKYANGDLLKGGFW